MAKPKQRGKPGYPIPAYEPGMGRGQGGDASASQNDGAVYGRRGPGSMMMRRRPTVKTKANTGSKTGPAKAKAASKTVAAKPRQASKKKGK